MPLTTADTMLVGRGAELRKIGELLEDARRGHAGGLLVLGAPGVGKTRLLFEASKLAGERRIRVGHSTCQPMTTPLPFDPFLDLLHSLGEPIRGPAVDFSRELFGALVERLEQASVDGPILVILDDLQWSDAATIELVQYCLARLRDLPLAWILAARSGRSQGGLAHRLESGGLADRMPLDALSEPETRHLAEAMMGDANGTEALFESVYQRTGGNPFLCVELLRALPPADTLADASCGGAAVTLEALVPATVSDAIEDRTSRLSGLTWVRRRVVGS